MKDHESLVKRTLDRLAELNIAAAMNPGGDMMPPEDIVQNLYASTIRPELRKPLLRPAVPDAGSSDQDVRDHLQRMTDVQRRGYR